MEQKNVLFNIFLLISVGFWLVFYKKNAVRLDEIGAHGVVVIDRFK